MAKTIHVKTNDPNAEVLKEKIRIALQQTGMKATVIVKRQQRNSR